MKLKKNKIKILLLVAYLQTIYFLSNMLIKLIHQNHV